MTLCSIAGTLLGMRSKDSSCVLVPMTTTHRDHVCQVFQRLRENHLYAKLEKCLFEVKELPFLGYIVSKRGLAMDPSKLSAVLDWPQPRDLKGLQRFLANFYRKFIKNSSAVVLPLTNLTKKGMNPSKWTKEAGKAFETLKQAFCSAPILTHSDTS
ncbi:uncharacterized mitochondrial protein AtMg00860-like [Bufo gargarizans]|uniref:uncharacterized mitochondrial protein AtMg00860-like n=1 Tax=Bufo gargarizans TaxID=30331 RepID=UPI001CF5FB4D|nr:uncharacterized mitochondrial protein AtMg00860-like [Bufo gargarizans]